MNKKAQFFPLKDENPRSKFPFVNFLFIGINVAVFVFSLTSFEYFINNYGFTPAKFSILTLFTSMFLHGGIAHIFGNMWFLHIFGDNVEDKFGHFKYVIFYILSGIAASLLHLLLNIGSNVPAVGASGAISGVLGAYVIIFPNVKVHVIGRFYHGMVSTKFMLGIWFLFQLVSGTFSLFGAQSGIAFFAHIGGFVFGAGFALIYKLFSK
ncbi:rhomboid family intramembrane serine protease [Candidatus Woesearchaeota archaeon]|nr:rhomboid family intramembrane serine protease [Candidatus Woesearchaeota archaeon]